MRKAFGFLLFFPVFFLTSTSSFASDLSASNSTVLKTRYTSLHYGEDKVLSDFAWRISGQRLNPHADGSVIGNAVDRIAERVQALLDMFPDQFRVDIFIHPAYEEGHTASYSHPQKEIRVYADRVTDGILAHEIAHAVINAYFTVSPPEKVQEILAQYVDQHLWSDY